MDQSGLRIVVADDHEIVRWGLRALIETEPGWIVCGEARNGKEAVEKVEELAPDVVVMDLLMPQLSGVEATRRILGGKTPGPGILILTAKESESLMQEVLAAGARGYVLKSDVGQDLIGAVKSVSEGRSFFSPRVADVVMAGYLRGGAPRPPEAAALAELTPRERQVLQLLAEGLSNKQVADSLRVSVKTAETHRANLMKKLHAQSVSDLVRYAIRNHLVEP